MFGEAAGGGKGGETTKNRHSTMATPMDEENPSSAPPAEMERYFLSVYRTLRTTQAQQGLKHGDFLRYRKYCSRRLLRLYKSLKHSHGKGKYEANPLKAEDVTEARFFLIPLMNAERAWAHAMEIKKETENAKNVLARTRHHMVKKLRKANKWAEEFAKVCSTRATKRTALESEAYASFVKGNYLLEVEERWSAALQLFLQTRAIYEQLGRGKESKEDGSIFLELQSELEPIILFCKYQQQKEQGTSKVSDLQKLKETTEGMEMSEDLKAKLDTLMSEAEQSLKIDNIEWRGKTLAIPGLRLVGPTSDVFAQMKKMEEEETATLEKSLEAYGALFTMFDTIKQVIQSEKSEVAGGGASAMSAEVKEQKKKLEQFERAVSGLMLESRVKRNLKLIDSRWADYIPSNKEGRKAINTTPEEMYRLHEHLKLDVFDLSELASDPSEEDEALYDECSTAMNAIKTILCYFLAEQYNSPSLKKEKEAYLLYNRAIEYADMVEGSGAKGSLFAPVLSSAQKVSHLTRIGRCIAHAKACASTAEKDEYAAAAAAEAQSEGAVRTLLDNLGDTQTYFGASGKRIYRVPPSPETLPCQPFLLDTAIDHIDYPEVPKDKTDQGDQGSQPSTPAASILGGVSSMFGWGAK